MLLRLWPPDDPYPAQFHGTNRSVTRGPANKAGLVLVSNGQSVFEKSRLHVAGVEDVDEPVDPPAMPAHAAE